MPITIHRAIQPLIDLGVAALKAANNIWTGSNKFTGTVSLSGAEPADTLTLTEKDMWQDYFDVPSTNQVLGAVHFNYAQPSITPAQQAQARTNIGVVTAGGVAALGASGAIPGNGMPTTISGVTDEFDAVALIEPELQAGSNDNGVIAQFSASIGYGLHVGFSGSDLRVSLTPIATGGPYYSLGAYQSKRKFWVGVFKANGVWGVTVNGVAVALTGAQATEAVSSTLVQVLGGGYQGYGQFAGALHAFHIFNRALTADERAAVMRGEVPAALAKNGFAPVSTGSFTKLSGVGNISGASATGFTMDGAGYVGQPFADLGKTGRKVRVKFTSSAAGGYVYVEQGGGGLVAFSAGANVLELGSTDYANPGITFQCASATTISNFSAEAVIGTVARYEPENVTSLGRWLDSSGNGYDLIPGAGIAPLKPQPVQVRSALAEFSATAAVTTPSAWTFVKNFAGSFTYSAPSYLSSTTIYSFTASRDPGDSTKFTTCIPTTGATIIGVRNSSGAIDPTTNVIVNITWTE